MLTDVFILLVVYQLKHFLADYPLQTEYMLGKFKPGWDFVGPLTAHCLVHAGMTFLIAGVYIFFRRPDLDFAMKLLIPLALADFDFIIHFGMDRLKASPKLMGRWKAITGPEYMEIKDTLAGDADYHSGTGIAYMSESQLLAKLRGNVLFWWALGFDQKVHHLTHYAIILALIKS